VLSNGDVYVWGSNSNGRTGRGTTGGNTITPAKVTLPLLAGEKALRCEADLYNSLVLTDSGNVYSCGRNYQGRNGNNIDSETNQTTFQKINFDTVKIKDIKMSGYMCGALSEDGKIYVWGYGGNGRLGTGNSSNQSKPVMLDTPTGVKFKIFEISTTQGFAFTTDNKLYRWGYLNNGMLPGFVSSSTDVKPTEVVFSNLDQGENVVCAATIKSYFGYLDNVECMMFATDHGRLFASGQNNSNKLGVVNDNNGNSLDPVNAFSEVQNHGIYAGTVFTNISIGPNHTLVSTSTNTEYPDDGDNVAYVCGTSSYKDFGDGRTTMVFTKLKK
jgi:alpha-tubulin suppressor-like RCC1 family protein